MKEGKENVMFDIPVFAYDDFVAALDLAQGALPQRLELFFAHSPPSLLRDCRLQLRFFDLDGWRFLAVAVLQLAAFEFGAALSKLFNRSIRHRFYSADFLAVRLAGGWDGQEAAQVEGVLP